MKELIFHYCSIETFFMIIQNKTLRLSDITKSNDNLEVMWLKKIMQEIIQENPFCYDRFSDVIKRNVSIELYKKMLTEKTESFFNKKELKSKFFVICFSGNASEDKLSQWRGYGDDGKGVSIAFNKQIVEKTGKRMTYKLDKIKIKYENVEYNVKNQKQMLEDFWCEMVNIANEEVKTIEVDFELWLLNSFRLLYEKSIFMKSPFFDEEDESRIVLARDDIKEEIDDEL